VRFRPQPGPELVRMALRELGARRCSDIRTRSGMRHDCVPGEDSDVCCPCLLLLRLGAESAYSRLLYQARSSPFAGSHASSQQWSSPAVARVGLSFANSSGEVKPDGLPNARRPGPGELSRSSAGRTIFEGWWRLFRLEG
jgi:hypothetical protein